MKQVRQIFGISFLAIIMTMFSNHELEAHHPSHRGRVNASLAIDTYGFYDIRVWIDGVLINRRPTDYLEINSLRAGRRVIDVEIIGRRVTRTISQVIHVRPRQWNVWAIENLGRRGWFTMNRIQIDHSGFYYHRGRRESIRIPAYYNGYAYHQGNDQHQQSHRPKRSGHLQQHDNDHLGQGRGSNGNGTRSGSVRSRNDSSRSDSGRSDSGRLDSSRSNSGRPNSGRSGRSEHPPRSRNGG